MVPGFTLRESNYTETRRQELLARVAAEQLAHRFVTPNRRRFPGSTIFERAATLVKPLLRLSRMAPKSTPLDVMS